MFRFEPLKDPRAALFGLTLFSQHNPQLEKQLELVANILDATRNSLSIIRGEMHNFEASMFSAMAAPKPQAEFVTKPVEEVGSTISYTNPNYTQQPEMVQNQTYPAAGTVEAMAINEAHENEAKEKLQRFMDLSPDKMQDFLDDLESLIKKYR